MQPHSPTLGIGDGVAMAHMETTMTTTRLAGILILLAMAGGCSTTPAEPPKSGLQLQSYQAREFPTTKRIAFSATLSVFQDQGFIIDDGDFDTGLITATGPTLDADNTVADWLSIMLSGQSMATARHRRATAYVETMPSGDIRIRLNFVFTTQLAPAAGTMVIEPIEEPEAYQSTFADIDKAIFVRTQTI